jgi:hypothetical protein
MNSLAPEGSSGLGVNVNLGCPVNRDGEHRMGVRPGTHIRLLSARKSGVWLCAEWL